MFDLITTTETVSALVEVLLFVVLTRLARQALVPSKIPHRVIITTVGILLSLRYLYWRVTETVIPFDFTFEALASWTFILIEILSIVSAISSWVILSKFRSRQAEADANRNWWGDAPPKVAVLIPTYNEDATIIRRTVLGAQGIDYPNYEICVLDDSNRYWLSRAAERRGVTYFSREDNEGAKAGNINATLKQLMARDEPPEFVAILDADFVPHPNFINRTLSLMKDRAIGLVQTPQHYFNADPIQHNLGVSRAYPDEQRFFFDSVLEARDGWDIAFCCGTSCLIRTDALMEVGGFPTESVTEDMLLSLVLRSRGWSTAYLNEALTEGLAPEGIAEYINQRARWCLGVMQIVTGRFGLFSREKMRIRDRWSLIDSLLYWQITFLFRLAAIIFPLLYWFTGIVVVNAELPDVIRFFGTYYIWTIFQINFISDNKIIPVFNDVSLIVGARQIVMAAFQGLFGAKKHTFKVTDKGGDRTQVIIHQELVWFFVILIGLNLLGLSGIVLFPKFYPGIETDGKVIVVFWTLYNIAVLALAALVSIDLPREETKISFVPEQARVFIGDRVANVWIKNMTYNTMRVGGLIVENELEVAIDVRGIGLIGGTIAEIRPSSVNIVLNPTNAQYIALLRKYHSGASSPGIQSYDLAGIAIYLLRRLMPSNRTRT